MRIVQLNPFYFPYAGGIERRIRATSRRLAKRHEVHIVTAQQPGTEAGTTREDGHEVHRLPSRFPFRRFYNPPAVVTPGLDQVLAELNPDVVDYHFRWSPGYNRAVRGLKDCTRIMTYHNTYGEGTGVLRWLSRANDRLFMRTLKHADRIVAVSRFVADQLHEHGIPSEQVRVNVNGIEVEDVVGVEGRSRLEPPGRYVVGVGRLVPLKGFDLLVRALPDMPKDVHVVIVGKGPETPRLRALAERLGVADRLHLTGWIEEDEKIRLLKHALAYVHPARFEAFAISVLEAMAAGAPALISPVGGVPEAAGEAGVLVPPEPKAWAGAVAEVANDDERRLHLSQASRRQVDRMDWGPLTDALEAIYVEAG